MKKTEIRKQISLYIRGKLTEQETDWLWMNLMLHPDLLEELQLEAELSDLFKNNPDAVNDPDDLIQKLKKISRNLL